MLGLKVELQREQLASYHKQKLEVEKSHSREEVVRSMCHTHTHAHPHTCTHTHAHTIHFHHHMHTLTTHMCTHIHSHTLSHTLTHSHTLSHSQEEVMLSSANNSYYHLTGKLKFGILHIECCILAYWHPLVFCNVNSMAIS